MGLPDTSLNEGRYFGNVVEEPVLQIRDLSVRIGTDVAGHVRPLSGINLHVDYGEVVGILGESGAGKTMLALSIMRLLPPHAEVMEGTISFEGRPLLALRQRELRNIWGSRLTLVHQHSSVLNPALRVGHQVVEVLRAHLPYTRQGCRDRTLELFEELDLRPVERIYSAYPHQLSGGQRQRVVIALALACRPALVIADEPTSSLDPDTASEVIGLLRRLKTYYRTALLLVSHDLAPLERLADRIVVMYAGRIFESGLSAEVLQEARHPYTRALLVCAGRNGAPSHATLAPHCMPTIPGTAPDLIGLTGGCSFEPRCPDRINTCKRQLPCAIPVSATHAVSCLRFGG